MNPILFPALVAGLLAGGSGTQVSVDTCTPLPGVNDGRVLEDGRFYLVAVCQPGRAEVLLDGRPTGVFLDFADAGGDHYLGVAVE